jgi:hypothetical protein
MRREAIEDALALGESVLQYGWQDELGDVFLLTKTMEIYTYSKTVLGCYCWSPKTYAQLQKMGLIFNDLVTDDRIYRFYTDRANLPQLLELGTHKRRPHKNGQWIRDKVRRLGHQIRPITSEQKVMLRAKIAEGGNHDRQLGLELD